MAGATLWSISDSSPLVHVVAGEASNVGMKVLFWNAYQGSTASPEDPWQLALAPWDPSVVFQPSVLAATLISASVFTGWSYLQTGGQHSPLQSGRSYWNGFETDLWSGLALTAAIGVVSSTFTAIGEEGFFRGLQYTQLRSVAGQRVASLADVVLFAAAHVPQEVRSGLPAGVIAVNGLQRALAGWLLQNAFDQAGLEGSVAAHAWIDIIAEVSNFLLNGGVATLKVSLPLD